MGTLCSSAGMYCLTIFCMYVLPIRPKLVIVQVTMPCHAHFCLIYNRTIRISRLRLSIRHYQNIIFCISIRIRISSSREFSARDLLPLARLLHRPTAKPWRQVPCRVVVFSPQVCCFFAINCSISVMSYAEFVVA
jgi:hypothetical protein